MTVPIDYGMWGWVWDAERQSDGGEGPDQSVLDRGEHAAARDGFVWRPVHRLEPRGGSGPASADQLATFVLPSLIVGDGSGAAEIAGRPGSGILGTGTETQFQFQGILSSQKPFRDWLTEVLNCCLGFYTWEFGQLKLGCRINASAADAYTRPTAVSEPAPDADPVWLRAPGDFVRRRCLSIPGEHG
jgi:hypothetical protein